MKPILNKEIVLEWIAEQHKETGGKTTDTETSIELSERIGKKAMLVKLLELTENYI